MEDILELIIIDLNNMMKEDYSSNMPYEIKDAKAGRTARIRTLIEDYKKQIKL